jgi:5-methylcytosine-specific restriction endonuclease McrA
MKNANDDNALLSDAELLNEVKRLTADERQATSRLIAALGELDARRLYLGEGCSSLFTYCTQVLHLSEHAAYLRIEAARAARKWPQILDFLADGALHLTAVGLLASHLTADNHECVLAAARYRTKREIEELVATLRPLPAVPSSVRKLPAPNLAATIAAPVMTVGRESTDLPMGTSASNDESAEPLHESRKHLAEVKPLAPERYKVQFTVSRETHARLREAQDLLRHCVPDGDIGVIFDRALKLLVTELHKTRHATVERPRATSAAGGASRHVGAVVKRAVWARDKGQCAFVGAAGRCAERGFLEYHHVVPYAEGGATTAENLELRCRAHNVYESERWFGVSEEDLAREARASYSVQTQL